jgi:hypothetical protein
MVDTATAAATWDEARDLRQPCNGGRWRHERLYRARSGRYYVEHYSRLEGEPAHAEAVSAEQAARWLLLHEHALPEDLAAADDVSD